MEKISFYLDKFGEFVSGIISYFRGDEQPSVQECLGKWKTVAEYPADKVITGQDGGQAKVGEVVIRIEQNTNSGRLRAYYGEVTKIYLGEDEIGDALKYAEREGFLV